MIFVTSDHHFDHDNIRGFCKRPHNSVQEMNEDMIQKWNSVVGAQDEVYHLGDFCFQERVIEKIVPRLNGKIYLIRGNHDARRAHNVTVPMSSGLKRSAFMWVKDVFMLSSGGHDFWLSHYPHLSWPKSFHGSICLHGHTHNNIDYSSLNLRLVNVGVDVWGFYPVPLEKVIEKVKDIPNNRA